MSLVCSPQTGKVLNYNSSVNNQLVHKRFNWHSSRQATKLPKRRETVKVEKYEIRDSGDGELVPGLTPSNHELTPTAMTDRGSGITVRWWLNRRRRTGGVSGSNTIDTTNGRRQRRNGSGSYGRKRPRRGTVTRGDDTSNTSVQKTHSVAPSRWRRTWTAARQHVYRQLRSTLSSAAGHTDGSASARPSGNSDSPSDSQSDNFVVVYWVTFIHPLSSASGAQF